jgi:hypothetical protein
MVELDDGLREFVTGPVLLMVSAADAARRPAIGRAMGARSGKPGEIDVMVSRWQWPDVVRNIELTGRLALTASRASDYETYQLKGRAAVREAGAEELECARRYHQAIGEALSRGGVPAYLAAQWSADRGLVFARLRVDEVYVQTPGPRAGTIR